MLAFQICMMRQIWFMLAWSSSTKTASEASFVLLRPQKIRKLLGDCGPDRSLRRKVSPASCDTPLAAPMDINDSPLIPRKLRTGELSTMV